MKPHPPCHVAGLDTETTLLHTVLVRNLTLGAFTDHVPTIVTISRSAYRSVMHVGYPRHGEEDDPDAATKEMVKLPPRTWRSCHKGHGEAATKDMVMMQQAQIQSAATEDMAMLQRACGGRKSRWHVQRHSTTPDTWTVSASFDGTSTVQGLSAAMPSFGAMHRYQAMANAWFSASRRDALWSAWTWARRTGAGEMLSPDSLPSRRPRRRTSPTRHGIQISSLFALGGNWQRRTLSVASLQSDACISDRVVSKPGGEFAMHLVPCRPRLFVAVPTYSFGAVHLDTFHGEKGRREWSCRLASRSHLAPSQSTSALLNILLVAVAFLTPAPPLTATLPPSAVIDSHLGRSTSPGQAVFSCAGSFTWFPQGAHFAIVYASAQTAGVRRFISSGLLQQQQQAPRPEDRLLPLYRRGSRDTSKRDSASSLAFVSRLSSFVFRLSSLAPLLPRLYQVARPTACWTDHHTGETP
ncbi:hypothetical protein PMIN01_02096 [Paraphaeosphaeria minitans]|uniref:Uncharacterized protein n=1 Tax=Paraphaeosphaeria minitans TaxID=565426 RepID=A0A9P6KUK4_9PLEO|nr:hypothetical protein PMIN01_02096 [Paraphaeosphaeria minitans]